MHFCKRTPNVLHVLIEREEKGLKSWERKTVVSEMGRKWVPVWWAGISKCTSAICSKSDMREVQVTAVSWSQTCDQLWQRPGTLEIGWQRLDTGHVSRSHAGHAEHRLWTEPGRQCAANVAHFTGNELYGMLIKNYFWLPVITCKCKHWRCVHLLPCN